MCRIWEFACNHRTGMLVKPIGECDYRWVTSFKTVKLKKRPGPVKGDSGSRFCSFCSLCSTCFCLNQAGDESEDDIDPSSQFTKHSELVLHSSEEIAGELGPNGCQVRDMLCPRVACLAAGRRNHFFPGVFAGVPCPSSSSEADGAMDARLRARTLVQWFAVLCDFLLVAGYGWLEKLCRVLQILAAPQSVQCYPHLHCAG